MYDFLGQVKTDLVNIYTNGEHTITKEDYDHILAQVGSNHIIVRGLNIRDSFWDKEYKGKETKSGRELLNFIQDRD